MKTSKFTEEQIAFALKQVETGTPVIEVIRKMEIVEHSIGPSFDNFIPEELIGYDIPFIFFTSFYVICLPLPAIVCGSIDLKRIRTGRYSNKGKSLDIVGIVLGSVFILLAVWVILTNTFFSQ